MKFSEHWLRTLCNPPLTSAELCDKLTMGGLEVEEAAPAAPPFADVVVARIDKVEPHPGADRLRVCTVDAGLHREVANRMRRAERGRRHAGAVRIGRGDAAPRPGDQARDRSRRGVARHAVFGAGTGAERRCQRAPSPRSVAAPRDLRAHRACARRHADHVEDHAQPRRLPVGRGHRARRVGHHGRAVDAAAMSPRPPSRSMESVRCGSRTPPRARASSHA